MPRRADPARIDEAHRAGLRRRLESDGLSEATAKAWLAAWELHEPRAVPERGGAYWQAAWSWIAAERQTRTRPPPYGD